MQGSAAPGLWRLSRRRVLISLAALGLAPQPGAAARNLASPGLAATLRAFADTLVPRDESPGAGELGVHAVILREAEGRTNYPELLIQGTAWLDAEAGGTGFAAASAAVRRRVVETAFTATPGTLPHVFAEFLRQDVMRLYYARPESWAGMIDGPPQPEGHPFAHLPPEPRR